MSTPEGKHAALAREVALPGITANVVSPGLIDTPMLHVRPRPADERAALGLAPLERAGQPEEVAAAVSHLIGPEAGCVTGSTLDVRGGHTWPDKGTLLPRCA
ncbi:MAG: SDR family oxidoreductase [Comamonadaceae bacterium]|nr:SDR family oxidoreductase [Comamonadaceae bacterium]